LLYNTTPMCWVLSASTAVSIPPAWRLQSQDSIS
jgi:hypothetical protein